MILDGYCLERVADGHLDIYTFSASSHTVDQLRTAMKMHQPHAGEHRVAPVTIEVRKREQAS